MPKFNVLIAGFPYGRREDPDVGAWIGSLRQQLVQDTDRIGSIRFHNFDDTPITMTRNAAIAAAKDVKADLLLMVDSDMAPDAFLDRPRAKPFWNSSFEFMMQHPGPCIVAAPYCGPPPDELVYVFQLEQRQSNHPNVDFKLAMIPRETATQRSGIEEVIALPTGVMLIDMRAIEKMAPPYFDYEWADPPFNSRKASTEDVYFSRNAALAGIKVYSNWDAWAGHWKWKKVGPPSILTPDSVREQYRQAVASNHLGSNETLLFVKGSAHGHAAPSGKPGVAAEAP